jgi:hypothetical protein
MKNALYVIIVLALFLIGYSILFKNKEDKPIENPPKVHTGDEPFMIGDGRLEGSWIRFDGVYKSQMDKITYYLRFYPEGNVTAVGGNEEGATVPLKTVMRQDSPPGVDNIHNTLVDLKGDSIFFTTKFFKGEIAYSGARVDGDSETLRFLKHSLINGRKAILDYTFEAD